MTVEKINSLLQKYFDGDTSLEEEKILRGYFSSDRVDPQLAKYTPLFRFIDEEKRVEINATLAGKIEAIAPKTSPKMPPKMTVVKGGNWWKMAAAIAFLVVGSWAVVKQFELTKTPYIAQKGKAKVIVFDENSDPELALAEIEKALNKASRKMKKGTDEATESMQKVKTATKVLNQ
jgi:hypothetical protein